ncbi:MAG TPA: squalene/phytoene synthase family protein [Pseudolabrys sp.]|nr:squalene/phytoene synthase family protein [Pseudolabrys sp.]
MADSGRIGEAYRYCEALVRAHDRDRYLASLFAPAERRPFLVALYAFALEIGRVRSLVQEPITGIIRLQWWLEAVGGLRGEEAAASPVMIALTDAAQRTGMSLAPLAAAVEARQLELQGEPAIEAAAPIYVMAARLLGAEGDAVVAVAAAAARAVTLAATEPAAARQAYAAFRDQLPNVPEGALPAFLDVALVPLRLKRADAPQWRRQLVLLRTAWFGFPKA